MSINTLEWTTPWHCLRSDGLGASQGFRSLPCNADGPAPQQASQQHSSDYLDSAYPWQNDQSDGSDHYQSFRSPSPDQVHRGGGDDTPMLSNAKHIRGGHSCVANDPLDQHRGGMFMPDEIDEDQLSLNSDQDADKETHLLNVPALTVEPYSTFSAAVQKVCTIATVITKFTIGYYHSPRDETLDFVITDACRESPPTATFCIRSLPESWIVFDSLIRLAKELKILMNFVSLVRVFDDPASWDWRLPPQGFNTTWATRGRRHVIVIDYNSKAMMVFTMDQSQSHHALPQFRGGNPDYPRARGSTAPLEQPAFEEPPPPPTVVHLPVRALFIAHVLLHHDWFDNYAATLQLAAHTLELLLSTAVRFSTFLDDVIFYVDNSPPAQPRQQITIHYLLQDRRAGIAFMDILARAQHAGHIAVAAINLQGPGHNPSFQPGTLLSLIHWEPSATAWATWASGRIVMVVDVARGAFYIVAAPSVPHLEYRGGASSPTNSPSTSMDLSSPEDLPPRMRMRRIQLYLQNAFRLPETFYVTSALLEQHELRKLVLGHIGCLPSWVVLQVHGWTWTYRLTLPQSIFTQRTYWAITLAALLTDAQRLYLGYRATRQHGLLVSTHQHVDLIQRLNTWAAQWVSQDFYWNAMAIINHTVVARHCDRFNAPQSVAMAFSPHTV
eukprot:4784038-Amphidinium_carterae.5